MIRITEAEKLADRIDFIYNPLSELALFLDLLAGPEHHRLHSAWADRIFSGFSNKEKTQFYDLEKKFDGYLNLDRFLDYLSFDFSRSFDQEACRRFILDRENWSPGSACINIDEAASFLCYIWDSYVYPVIGEHENAISAQMDYGKKLLGSGGLAALFEAVSDRVSAGRGNSLTIDKWVESSFSAGDLGSFYLELSLFAFPHLVISDRHEAGFFFLSWDVPFRGDRLVAPGIDRISGISFALSDKSRLRILLMLSGTPMTQKDIGRQMGFAKSTISRHIGILLAADLVKQGAGERNVLLYMNEDVIRNFPEFLLKWLGREG